MTELEKYIQSYFAVAKEDLTHLATFFKPVSLNKGDFFLKEGHYSDQLAFVQKGILREFVTTDKGEVTKWISTPGYFTVDLASYIFDQPARWSIQALADCELYAMGKSDYQKIGQVIPDWVELEKRFIARCFTVLEERVVQHLSLSAEERYQRLFDFNSELFNQVPLQYLASMLGMTPETLSRIRRKAVERIS